MMVEMPHVNRSRADPPARAVVTGGAGFIGHHLVSALIGRGSEVLVVDDLSTGKADRLPAGVRMERLDIATDDLTSSFESWRPSVVFHLAAQASVPRSEAMPEEDLRVNALGTLRVIAAARSVGASRIVFTSSGGAVYGETPRPATERSPARPDSLYGHHKLLAERYVARSGLSHAIVRPSNVYGPGQDAVGEGAVVAAFTDAARGSGRIVIHGDGSQERDFLNVADLVEAVVVVAASSESGTWNASFGRSMTIADVAALVERVAGRRLERGVGPRRPGDVHLSRIASARLRRLGWTPQVPFDEGLRQLLESGG
jgi:UDP-glucose 4-epimerase